MNTEVERKIENLRQRFSVEQGFMKDNISERHVALSAFITITDVFIIIERL